LSELEAHHQFNPQPPAEPTRNENVKKLISLSSSYARDVQRIATGNNTFFSKSVLSTGNAKSTFGGLNNALPSFFLLNATSVAKGNARQHLHADVYSCNSDIVLTVETWFTNKHRDTELAINGYNLFRRDRKDGRKGGGLCAYVRNNIECVVLQTDVSNSDASILTLKLCG
jgi:hypothetical protein